MERTETQQVLAEIRNLHSHFDELSLQIRIDTPWIRAKNHVRYAINLIAEIPKASRILFFIAAALLTVAYGFNVSEEAKKKLGLLALDTAMLGMVVMNNG